jgi:hypothetical protein
MTPLQVELVAQAFYAAEFSIEWCDAPEPLREEFRECARDALLLLHRQISECRSSTAAANASEPAPRKEAIRLVS